MPCLLSSMLSHQKASPTTTDTRIEGINIDMMECCGWKIAKEEVSRLYIFITTAIGTISKNYSTIAERIEVMPIWPSPDLVATERFISSIKHEPQEITVIPIKM